jgi:DNA-binding transcriptional regulator YiaG
MGHFLHLYKSNNQSDQRMAVSTATCNNKTLNVAALSVLQIRRKEAAAQAKAAVVYGVAFD